MTGDEDNVKLVLNKFCEEENEKLIPFLMKEDQYKKLLCIMLHVTDMKES